VVNVSYYYGFNDLPSRLGSSPAELAAGVVRSALLFREKLKNGQIAPDAVKDGAHCMDTWRWMFDACRIPGAQGLDWSVSAAKQGDEVTKHEGHVIVLRKGRFWKVDVAPNGHILSSADLAKFVFL
jgi:carnitine O-acetyltransferase